RLYAIYMAIELMVWIGIHLNYGSLTRFNMGNLGFFKISHYPWVSLHECHNRLAWLYNLTHLDIFICNLSGNRCGNHCIAQLKLDFFKICLSLLNTCNVGV